ncbi:MAG: hypothetical protein QOE91_520 [Gaiellaceae bacterium]|nr:hypothetical protein [Gaiellaceae bacterium]
MGLADDLARTAEAAAPFAVGDERLEAVLAAEPDGSRIYLCAFGGGNGRSWIALDNEGRPVTSRKRLREGISIAALCEIAGDTAGGGRLEELRQRLVALRLTENPPGIDEAEEAAFALEAVIGAPPRLATPAFLNEVGLATQRLELALGEGNSPFSRAMASALDAVEALTQEVESTYKQALT